MAKRTKDSKRVAEWRARELAAGRRLIARVRGMSPGQFARWAAMPATDFEGEPTMFGPIDESFSDDSVWAEQPGWLAAPVDEDAAFWAAFEDAVAEEVASPWEAADDLEPDADLERLQKRDRTMRSVAVELLSRVDDPAATAVLEAILDLGAIGGPKAWAAELESSGTVAPGAGQEAVYRALSAAWKASDGKDRQRLNRAGVRLGRLSPEQMAAALDVLGLRFGVLHRDVRAAKVAAMRAAETPEDQAAVAAAADDLLRCSERDLLLDPFLQA